MPVESTENAQEAPKAEQGVDRGTGGDVARKKRKPNGGYNWKSHGAHPGVSVVKKRGRFWLKWRINAERGVYRYEWHPLPDEISDRELAHGEAKRKSEELKAAGIQTRNRRKGSRHLEPVTAGLVAYVDSLVRERREREPDFVKRAQAGAEGYLSRFTAYITKESVNRCERLTIDDLADFRNSLDKCGLKNVSINRELDGVRAAMNYMIGERYLTFDERDVGKALKHYEVGKHEPRILKQAEMKRLIEKLLTHDRARFKSSRKDKPAYHTKQQSESAARRYKPLAPFMILGLLTGARPNEVERITAGDVSLDHGYILVRDTKRNHDRTIPLHDSPLLHDLVAALQLRAGGGALVGKVKLNRVNALGLEAGIGVTTDADGNESSDLNRQMLRRTCIAHVASGSSDSEYLLGARFGHGTEVSIRHYRQALHGVRARGDTVEAWLGVEKELRAALVELGYFEPAQTAKVKKVGT